MFYLSEGDSDTKGHLMSSGRTRRIATGIVVAAAAAALTGAGAGVAHAGLLDGTLNNADILDHVNLLDSNINSDPVTSENGNANTRARGDANNSSSE